MSALKKESGKFVFFDTNGRRWRRIKLFLLLFVAGLSTLAAVTAIGFFDQPKNLLPKLSGLSNFGTIQNIIDHSVKKVDVNGSGTFVNIKVDKTNDTYTINRSGSTEVKKVVLTFDDGPDPIYTPKILSILKREGVPATFFVVGEQVLKYPDLVKQEAADGFEIGNHTFSHTDANLNNPKNGLRVDFELNFSQKLIEQASGTRTLLFRAPYWGSENDISDNTLVLTTFALDKGYLISTPTEDSNDWQERSVDRIVHFSTTNDDGIQTTSGTVVLLFHDAGGDRHNTILALPKVIEYYRQSGFQFTTLGSLAGSPVNIQPSFFERFSSTVLVDSYKFYKAIPKLLTPIFVFGLGFTLLYGLFIIVLANVELFRSTLLKKKLRKTSFQPAVTVVVPAYNEEAVIGKTISSILASSYKKLRVLVIDDGSADRTFEIAKSYQVDPRVKVLHKENGGKFSALNFGLKHIRASVYIALDADTQVTPDAVGNLVRFFSQEKIGAVAGNVRVGNRKSLMGILQSIEYTMNLNLERNGYSLINSILVVPGALGAWRTKAVKAVGGYSDNTLTEDAELTLRLLKKGYRAVYDKDSISYTEVPKKPTQLAKQRLRWNFGVFQTFYAHKDLLFRPRAGFLGMIVLPFTIFVQIPIMILTPFMDLFAIYAVFFVSTHLVVFYLVLYLTTRICLGVVAFVLEGENPWPLFFLPLQRLVYQPLLYLSLYQSLLAIFKGNRLSWNKISRDGSVNLAKLPA